MMKNQQMVKKNGWMNFFLHFDVEICKILSCGCQVISGRQFWGYNEGFCCLLCKLCAASPVMIIKCLVLLTVNSRVKKMFFPREWIARCQFFGFSPLASSSVVSLPKSPIWLLRIAVLFKNRNLHPYSASFWNYSYFNFYVHVKNWNIEVGRKKG